MKKILCILLAITMLFGLCACGKEVVDNPKPLKPNENQTDTDNKQENVGGLKFNDFFYDVTDWDKLESKDNVDLKLCGISNVPFNVVDFKDNITEFDAFHIYTKEAENILDYKTVKDFNEFIDGTKMIKPNYSTTGSNSINLDLDNGATFEMMITAKPEEDNVAQDILTAVNKGRHFYYAMYDVEKFLDIDMTGIEFSTGGDKPNAKPLLEKAIEKFGKPTEIKIITDNTKDATGEDMLMGIQSYQLIYEFESYVLEIDVSETQIIFGDSRDISYMHMSAFVFAPNAWENYKIEKNS